MFEVQPDSQASVPPHHTRRNSLCTPIVRPELTSAEEKSKLMDTGKSHVMHVSPNCTQSEMFGFRRQSILKGIWFIWTNF
jgi:hypothetical protein